MSTVKKPILGITMGDPFGNGPEITVRALADETVYDRCRPLVVGDAASMEYAAAVYNKLTGAAIHVHSAQSVQEAQFVPRRRKGGGHPLHGRGAEALRSRRNGTRRRSGVPVCEARH